jgi:hypothetical protein
MKVCPEIIVTINGPPASFTNRLCLEKCRNVGEVIEFTQEQPPLGPYHLSLIDRTEGASIHFYQLPNIYHAHAYRKLEPEAPFLFTLNCRYNPEPVPESHILYRKECKQVIEHFFEQRGEEPVEIVRQLPPVNNWRTTHSVKMGADGFCVAFDNAFAGYAPLD